MSANSRILAIDPTNRGFGFAVLEGTDNLIDWGTISASEAQIARRIEKLIDRYRPTLVVTEDLDRNKRRGARGRVLIGAIRGLAKERKVRYRAVSPEQIRSAFPRQRTKYARAVEIAAHFPELEPRLPTSRKPWQSESEVMGLFDAMELILASLFPASLQSNFRCT